jgi:hypothetical protein
MWPARTRYDGLFARRVSGETTAMLEIRSARKNNRAVHPAG